MVRIHVVKASRLALGIALIALAVVLVCILIGALFGGESETVPASGAGYVQSVAETEASQASASAVFGLPNGGIRSSVVFAGELEPVARVQPTVLIYHTHTHEAYEMQYESEYVEASAWRTLDNRHNIVRVGDELAKLLYERGFTVVHDTTDHELDDHPNSYTRSLDTLKGYAGKADIFIDVHRDAYVESSASQLCVTDGDKELAQLMFVVGNGEGFSEKPLYAENYMIASRITRILNDSLEGLCRPVLVKDGRYNQHVSDNCLLVEVGHNRNSLEQALNSVEYLADAIYEAFLNTTGVLVQNT